LSKWENNKKRKGGDDTRLTSRRPVTREFRRLIWIFWREPKWHKVIVKSGKYFLILTIKKYYLEKNTDFIKILKKIQI